MGLPVEADGPRTAPRRRRTAPRTAGGGAEALRAPVSVIIPSWTGNVERTLRSLECQTFRDFDVEVIQGVSPAGRARNLGVARTRGELILFIDDDAYLGHERVLERMVETLTNDPSIGIVGPSLRVPPDANAFQRRLAAEAPRWAFPIHDADFETNPPLDRYGHSAISTTCCLLRRRDFCEVEGFDDSLPTGPEDTDLFYRLRKLGHRFVVPSNCWVYHHPPRDLATMARKYFRYGVGHALEARKTPDRHLDVVPLDSWYGKLVILLAPFLPVLALFVSFYFESARELRTREVKLGLQPLKAASTYAVLYGYAWGWFRSA